MPSEAATTSSLFPLPPFQYINLFTDENRSNHLTPAPPRPISDGQYSLFGQTIAIDDQIIRSLESQGLRRLYPREYDHRRELKKINSSILVNFLDLLDVMVRCPDTTKRQEKCNDIQLLFITIHHLMNELRPHQARESIRVWLHSQKRHRIETTARLNKQIDRVNDLMTTAINSITEQTMNPSIDFPQNSGHITSVDNNTDLKMDQKSDSDHTYQLDAFMCDLVDDI